ncbi:hypothetical protein CEXT_570201 [Caerostris extrusa]|uniref:Uncharacterized protein n=1 Tax=Caerostris extrusa TaxID=172846 RepID=A0AAV4W6V1_CAEEX|nr:hypothetical protein CEXT_570201 [Caerostris extrusa]
MSLHAGVSSMMEMEVSPNDSQSFRAEYRQPLLNNISNLTLPMLFATLCNPLNRKSEVVKRSLPLSDLRKLQIHAANHRTDGLVPKCHGARGTKDLNTSTKGKTNWFLPKVSLQYALFIYRKSWQPICHFSICIK